MTALSRDLVDRAISGEPVWRAEERRAAFEVYESLGMPDERDELWRYVDLDFDIADFALADGEPAASVSVESLTDLIDGVRVEMRNGVVTAVDGAAQAGLTITSAADADDATWDLMESISPRVVAANIDVFSAAHSAFGSGGVVIHVARNARAPAVLVDSVATTAGTVSFPRVLIVTEESAQASVVVHLRSSVDGNPLVVPRVEIVAGAASNVDVSTVQTLDRSARSVGHLRAVIGRDATVTAAEAGIGGALSRWHLVVDLEGRGSNANIIGAYFGDRQQILDYRYFMHHAGLNTTSNMFLKGAVEDEALSVFTGMIRIDEGAQRTDAFQTNRNLILSDGAAAQSVPNLEILANDVKCGHASSVGPLDEEQRYYLMSRGLDPERADRLQVRGFFEEAIARFPHPEIAASLRTWMNQKFIEAQQAGRL